MRFRTSSMVLVAVALAGCNGKDGGDNATGTDVQLTTDKANHFDLDVAADGRLAYAKPVDGASAVFVTDSVGRNARRLTNGVWDFQPTWSPDGKWIAFNRETNTQDVLIVSSDGGAERAVTSDPNLETVIGWLPDGSGVVYGRIAGSRYETWVYTLSDSSRKPLVEDEGGVFAVPSPDGKWIAYESIKDGRRTIKLLEVATGTRKALTTDGYEQLPIDGRLWSHDSQRLAFVSSRSGTQDIWLAEITTGALKQLTRDVRDDYLPTYERNGRRIAFLSTRGGQTDVWAIADSGGDEVRITDDVAAEFGVRWTPDGNGVFILGVNSRSKLYSVSIDGGPVTTLTDDKSHARDFAITPDGSRIVYEREEGGDLDLYSIPIAGGEPTLLVSSPAREVMPDISPDGSKVLFASNRAGEADLFVVPIAGGTPRQLTTWNSREDEPRWSPDGTSIMFLSNREGQSDLWMMDSSGADPRRVTSGMSVVGGSRWSNDGQQIAINGATYENAPGIQLLNVKSGASITLRGRFLSDPWWSPNDSLIAVADLSGGFGHIDIFTAKGEKVRRLTPEGRQYTRGPEFTPDGKRLLIAIYDFPTDYYDVAVVPVEGGEIQKLSNHKGALDYFRLTPNGRTVIYSGIEYNGVFYKRKVPRAQ
jgi:TolB protein